MLLETPTMFTKQDPRKMRALSGVDVWERRADSKFKANKQIQRIYVPRQIFIRCI